MRHAASSILAKPRLTTHIYGVWLPLAGIVAPHHTIHLPVCYATTLYPMVYSSVAWRSTTTTTKQQGPYKHPHTTSLGS